MSKMTTAQKCTLITGIVAVLASQGIADAKLDEFITQKKFDDAINYVNTSLTPQNRTLNEWMQLAQSYQETKNETKALATFIIAGRMNPTAGAPLAGAASIYFDQGNFVQAEEFGKKAFELTPDANAAWQFARASIKLGKPAEAKAALEKVIAADPANVSANSSLGQIYYDEKEYAKASTLLELAYKNGASKELAYKVALSYRSSGKNDKAKEFYDLAVAGDSKLYTAMVELADLSFEENNFARSFTEYGRAKAGVALTATQTYRYAVSAEKESKSETEKLYRDAVTAFVADKSAPALAARLYVADKDHAKKAISAIDHYNFYLASKGTEAASSPIWFRLAEMQVAQKQNDAAIVSLEKSIALDKKNAGSYALLAEIYSAMGNTAKSESTLEGLISQNQSDPTVYLKLGDYKLAKKEYVSALANFEKSASLSSTPEAAHGIALSAAPQKLWVKVIPAAKQALAAKDDLVVRKALVEALVATDASMEAIPEVAKVLEKEPKNISYWKMQYGLSEKVSDQKLGLAADSALITLEPGNIDSRKRYSAWLLSQKKTATAFPIVVELTKLEATKADHWKTASALAVELDKKTEAILFLEGYLKLNTTDLASVIRLGEMYYGAQRFDEALAMYRKALSINAMPEGFPYDHYAEIVIKKGQTDEVIKALTGLVSTGKADVGTFTTLGMLYKNKKEFAKAIPMYEKALSINPADLASSVAIGECQLASGNAQSAIVSFEQAQMMNPDSVIVYAKLGDAYSASGDKATAAKNYRSYIEKGGKNSDIAFNVGMSAINSKDNKLAEQALALVKAPKSETFDYLYAYSNVLFAVEKWADASAMYEKTKTKGPSIDKLKTILFNIAVCAEKQGKTAVAIRLYDEYVVTNKWPSREADFKRAFLRESSAPAAAKTQYRANIVTYADDMRNHLQLGKMLTSSAVPADLKEGATLLEKVLTKAGASNAELLLTVAEAYGKAKMPEKELEAYKKYTVVKADDANAWVRIGDLYSSKGKHSDAVLSYESAAALDPKRVDIMIKTGKAYVRLQQWNNAIPVLKQAGAAQPENLDVIKLLVDAYAQSGKKEEARQLLKKLVAEGDPKYLAMYVGFLMEEKNYNEAEKIIDDMLAAFAEDPAALLMKGQILRSKGDLEGALEHFKTSSELDLYNAEAHFEMGETYYAMTGAKKRFALKSYDKAIQLNPEHGKAWFGKATASKLFKLDVDYKDAITKAAKLLPDNATVQAEAKAAGVI